MGLAPSSAVVVYRWSRFLNRKLPFSKHHLWMINRPLVTSEIKERGKGLHRDDQPKVFSNIEVRDDSKTNKVSIVDCLRSNGTYSKCSSIRCLSKFEHALFIFGSPKFE